MFSPTAFHSRNCHTLLKAFHYLRHSENSPTTRNCITKSNRISSAMKFSGLTPFMERLRSPRSLTWPRGHFPVPLAENWLLCHHLNGDSVLCLGRHNENSRTSVMSQMRHSEVEVCLVYRNETSVADCLTAESVTDEGRENTSQAICCERHALCFFDRYMEKNASTSTAKKRILC